MDGAEVARTDVARAAFSTTARANEVALSELQNKFYKNLPGIRDAIFDSLVEHGYYLHRPDKVRQAFIGGGIVAGVLLFGVGQYAAQKLGMQALPFVVGRDSHRGGNRRVRLVHACAHR